jgi:hypothetical protein
MHTSKLYLSSCDLQTTFSSYTEQSLVQWNIRRKVKDDGKPQDTKLNSIIIWIDIVLWVQLSSKLVSIAGSIFIVMIITEGRISLLLNMSYFQINREELHFSETYNDVSHNNRVIVRNYFYFYETSRDISVGIATGYGIDRRSSFLGRDRRCFCTPQCSHRLWGPPSLLSNGYWGLFARG